MKIFLLVPFLTLLLSSPAKPARVNVSKTFTCTLTVARTQYKLGELPELKVEIANNTDKNVYLLGSLDGSSVKGRMPYCYFTIIKSIADTIALGRCGNMNTLRLKDFVLIKSGEKFDPYQEIDSYGFFNDPWVQSPETFKKKGTYRIRFNYSTNSQDILDFMGDMPFKQSKSEWSEQITPLLNQVPKIDLVSNEIEIIFQ